MEGVQGSIVFEQRSGDASSSVTVDEHDDPTREIVKEIERHALAQAVVRVIYDIASDDPDTVDLRTVRRALSDAHFVAGIAPSPRPVVHHRRADITEEMAVRDALTAYVKNRPDLKEIEEDLQSFASGLEKELLYEGPSS